MTTATTAPIEPIVSVHEVETIEDSLRIIGAEIVRSAPEVRGIVGRLLSEKRGDDWAIEERDTHAELSAIHNYVLENVKYMPDVRDFDTFQRALLTVDYGIGDCDDMTILVGAMAMSVGYPVRLRVTDSSGQWDHIYAMIGVPQDDPDEWVASDVASGQRVGWEQSTSGTNRRLTVSVHGDGIAPVAELGKAATDERAPLWAWAALLIGLLKVLRVV